MSIELPSYRQCYTRFCPSMMWVLIRYVLSSGSLLVLPSGQKDWVIVTPGSSPGVQWIHAAILFFSVPPQLGRTGLNDCSWSEAQAEFMKQGGYSARCFSGLQWGHTALPECGGLPSIPFVIEPITHLQMVVFLWPVTLRSRGQGRVNRGQSLRTPHIVPLSSQGHVAH